MLIFKLILSDKDGKVESYKTFSILWRDLKKLGRLPLSLEEYQDANPPQRVQINREEGAKLRQMLFGGSLGGKLSKKHGG